jgi:hypothetical protein
MQRQKHDTLVLHVGAGQFFEKALHAQRLAASQGSVRRWEEERKVSRPVGDGI